MHDDRARCTKHVVTNLVIEGPECGTSVPLKETRRVSAGSMDPSRPGADASHSGLIPRPR